MARNIELFVPFGTPRPMAVQTSRRLRRSARKWHAAVLSAWPWGPGRGFAWRTGFRSKVSGFWAASALTPTAWSPWSCCPGPVISLSPGRRLQRTSALTTRAVPFPVRSQLRRRAQLSRARWQRPGCRRGSWPPACGGWLRRGGRRSARRPRGGRRSGRSASPRSPMPAPPAHGP